MIKHNKLRKGQSLVMVLLLAMFLTVIIASIGSIMIKSRNILKIEKKKDDLYYATRSAQQIAFQNIVDTAKTKANAAQPSWDSTGYIFEINPNNTTRYPSFNAQGLFNVLKTDTLAATATYKGTLSGIIKNLNSSGNTVDANISNKIVYRNLFCNDKNGDGMCNYDGDPAVTNQDKKDLTKEEGITLISAPFVDPNSSIKSQKYTYRYTITSYAYMGGDSNADFQSALAKSQVSKLITTGTYDVVMKIPTIARFAILQDTSQDSFGFAEYFGEGDHIKGPLHLNGYDDPFAKTGERYLNLFEGSGTNANAVFDGKVTISNKKINFNGDGVMDVTGNTNPQSAHVHPKWNGGFQDSAPIEKMPQTTDANASVALGGEMKDSSGNPITTLTDKQKNQMLNAGGYTSISATSTSPPPVGLYMTHTTPSLGNGSLTGGIYIQGDVDKMVLSVGVDPMDASHEYQDYSVTQGTKTTNIRIDRLNNTTTVTTLNGSTNTGTTIFDGIPKGQIQVQGAINNLGGPLRDTTDPDNPDKVKPAIQKDNALSISASGNIKIQSDIKYEVDPRGPDHTFGGGDDPSNIKNVLGLFSSQGKVVLGLGPNNPPGASGNHGFRHDPTIHATIMAGYKGNGNNDTEYGVKTGGELLIEGAQDATKRPPGLGQLHLLGGALTHYYGNNGRFDANGLVSGLPFDFEYDERNNKGNPPPYFPESNAIEFSSEIMPEIASMDQIDKGTININKSIKINGF